MIMIIGERLEHKTANWGHLATDPFGGYQGEQLQLLVSYCQYTIERTYYKNQLGQTHSKVNDIAKLFLGFKLLETQRTGMLFTSSSSCLTTLLFAVLS